jgi:hypothetical protein
VAHTVRFLLLIAAALGGSAFARYQPALDARALADAIAIGQTRVESQRARFHQPYRIPVNRPPVDYIEVVTPFRRVALAAEAAHRLPEPLVLTARAENHISGVDDFEDTVARLRAYRDAGADVVYAPGLTDLGQIETLVDAVGLPVNVLALPQGPSVAELASVGVRRVSTGGALAGAAYGALLAGARELREDGTSRYAERRAPMDALRAALRSPV